MDPTQLVTLIGEIVALLSSITAVIVAVSKLIAGQKCLLRTEMLRIYYNHQDAKQLRQFEYENFVLLYEAYKRLKGNSFIDKVYDEVKVWKVVT